MKSLYSLLLVLFTAVSIAQPSSFKVQITTQLGTGATFISRHNIGVSPQSTFGLDTNRNLGTFLEEQLPPFPPTYAFESRIKTLPGHPAAITAGLGSGVMNDYRAYVDTAQVDSFKIDISGDSVETNTTTISWGTDLKKYAGDWKIKPQAGSEFPTTDMLSTTSVTIPAGVSIHSVIIIKKGVHVTGMLGSRNAIPGQFSLEQNYPNPFNPETKILYTVATAGKISVQVFDMLGKDVANLVNQVQQPGYYSVSFNGASLPSGIYFYRLQSASHTSVRRMMLIK